MKVLVTGGAGFIGSHSVDALLALGYSVRIVDNLLPQVHNGKIPTYLPNGVEFMQGDVSDPTSWEKWLTGVDSVLHLASMAGLAQSMYEPAAYSKSNVVGTANMYEVLVKNPSLRKNIQKIVVASSKTIYGEGAYCCPTHGTIFPELRPLSQLERKEFELKCPHCLVEMKTIPIPEEKPAQCLSVYALTKYATEKMALMYSSTLSIPTVAFRYFSVYGPRQSLSNPYTGVCSIFLSRIKNKQTPVIFEDGKQVRDFIFVSDIARANVLALTKKGEGVFNVGSGEGVSITGVCDTISSVLGENISPTITNEFRYGDTRNDLSDNSHIKKVFGFKPEYSFKQGISKLVEWGEHEEAKDNFDSAERERKRLLGK